MSYQKKITEFSPYKTAVMC